MKLFNKTSLKFFIGFVAIVLASMTIAFIATYFSPESRAQRAVVDQGVQGEVALDENQ